MKRLLIAAICLAFLAAGCIEEKGSGGSTAAKTAGDGEDKLTATINSPSPGEILQGDNGVSFDSSISGGKSPYTFRWSSNIDGKLSDKKSYQQNPSKLSKGEHNLIMAVTDAAGRSAQATVIIQVM